MALIFCGTTPLISLFAFFFFTFKYYIDKYNLTFVYTKEFEGGGVIKKQVLPFMIFSIYIFQLINIGFFATRFGDTYFKGGMVFVVLQSLVLLFVNIHYNTKKKKAREQLSKIEEMRAADNLENYDAESNLVSEEGA
jgi:hypothetical protein